MMYQLIIKKNYVTTVLPFRTDQRPAVANKLGLIFNITINILLQKKLVSNKATQAIPFYSSFAHIWDEIQLIEFITSLGNIAGRVIGSQKGANIYS